MTPDRVVGPTAAPSAVAPIAIAPPPPLGPGVQPPFVAPPTDGTKQRRWLAVGLSVGFAVLLCIGGLVGLGGLVVLGTQVIRDDAEATVTNYLGAVRDGHYDEAYRLLCDSVQAHTSKLAFIDDQLGGPRVASFQVGAATLSDEIVVPATVTYADQSSAGLDFIMAQDTETGAVEVCGIEG